LRDVMVCVGILRL